MNANAAARSLSADAFRKVARAVYRHTGVVVAQDKVSLMEGRLRRRVRALGVPSLNEYATLLSRGELPTEELESFIDVVTTHKTSFFRTESVWREFEQQILPQAASSGRPFRVWSGASSTGEEAYSIALLCEAQRQKSKVFEWSVLASDVAKPTVQKAQAGAFAAREIRVLARRYPRLPWRSCFHQEQGEMLATDVLKSRMSFRTHNLLTAIGRTFDVVFLRNVIIYFSEGDKVRALEHAAAALAPGGLLVTGESESLLSHVDTFEFRRPCLYVKPS